MKDGVPYDAFNINYDGAGDVVFTFSDQMTFLTYDDPDESISDLLISFVPGSEALGVQSEPGYDYSRLGETWSAPRILRIPNDGAGDDNIEDDIYAAVLGGGFGANNPQIGSNLFVINLEVDPSDDLFCGGSGSNRNGIAFRIYGCGIYNPDQNAENQTVVTLESVVILPSS